MVTYIELDDLTIEVFHFEQQASEALQVMVKFHVTSAQYHDIATFLYKGAFHVRVPEANLAFDGTIYNYTTSRTNLYEANQVAEYALTLKEVKG